MVSGEGRIGFVGFVAESKERNISMALASPFGDVGADEDMEMRWRRFIFIWLAICGDVAGWMSSCKAVGSLLFYHTS